MLPRPSIPRPTVPRESRRSLYRVLGKGGILIGLVIAATMTGVDPTPATPGRSIVALLGIREDVQLRTLVFAGGLAMAIVGFVTWRRSGGELHR